MSLLFSYVSSGQKELVVWCGIVPPKGGLQQHSCSGKLGDADLSVKHVGVQAQPEHLMNPYLSCYSNLARRTINRREGALE